MVLLLFKKIFFAAIAHRLAHSTCTDLIQHSRLTPSSILPIFFFRGRHIVYELLIQKSLAGWQLPGAHQPKFDTWFDVIPTVTNSGRIEFWKDCVQSIQAPVRFASYFRGVSRLAR